MKIDSFLKKYNGHRFVDEGAYCSNDFKQFARGFRSYLKRTLPGDCEIVNHRCGHYDLSGFIRHGDEYLYYSYSWDRFSPVDVNEGDSARRSVLIRHAESEKDFRGGFNHFTSIASLPDTVVDMFTSRAA